jgi:Zn-dependent protease
MEFFLAPSNSLFFVVSVSVFPLDGGHCVGQQLSRPAAHAATNVNSSSLRHHLIANTTRGKKSPSLSAQLAPAARRFPQKI